LGAIRCLGDKHRCNRQRAHQQGLHPELLLNTFDEKFDPAMTPKEKKAAKRAKKETKKSPGDL
jgi:hypothetical protein